VICFGKPVATQIGWLTIILPILPAGKLPKPQKSLTIKDMRIAELFRSLQGEGRLTGTPSVFIRLSGCNLRCRYCDTPFASSRPEGEDLSPRRIMELVSKHDCRHVVITGGEPMMFADVVPLSVELERLGFHITIETAGTLDLPVRCDLMSISPKLKNSTPPSQGMSAHEMSDSADYRRMSAIVRRHDRARHAPDVIRRLVRDYACQMKFVVDSVEDCREVESYLCEFPEIDRANVMLMPQGIEQNSLEEKARWLIPYCQENGLTFCPRRQIEWFGGARGT